MTGRPLLNHHLIVLMMFGGSTQNEMDSLPLPPSHFVNSTRVLPAQLDIYRLCVCVVRCPPPLTIAVVIHITGLKDMTYNNAVCY